MLVGGKKQIFTKQSKKTFTPKLYTWKLKDQDVYYKFQGKLINLMEGDVNLILESVEDKWNHIRARLHETRSELKPV